MRNDKKMEKLQISTLIRKPRLCETNNNNNNNNELNKHLHIVEVSKTNL